MWNPFRKQKNADPSHLRAGRWGESAARAFLKAKGCRIIGSRVRVGRRDEIDLIAVEDGTLLFVEVKTRAGEAYGRPVDAVNRGKRWAMGRAAVRYMKGMKKKPPYFRFDVVEVIGREEEGEPVIRHLKNVFTLPRSVRVPW